MTDNPPIARFVLTVALIVAAAPFALAQGPGGLTVSAEVRETYGSRYGEHW